MALKDVTISNGLYGSDIKSSFVIANGYTKPLVEYSIPNSVLIQLINAKCKLLAKRKLNVIMVTNDTVDLVVNPGDQVQINIGRGYEKRAKWTSPRVLQVVHHYCGTVTVQGMDGHSIEESIEDVIAAIVADDFASAIV